MRPPYINSFHRQCDERSSDKSCATPGLALSGKQLQEMALTGRVSVSTKQSVYEQGYDLDNPNPMLAPNVDISDMHKYSEQLAEQYESAVKEYEKIVKKANDATKKGDIKPTPTPAVDAPQQ